ncbi:MAG: iron-sulfur cluster assembly scaffold protein [bacterium]|nr:iron-sulfur cluster assembly scaffold protein [bacterium]
MYESTLLDHYHHPRNTGKLEPADRQHREPNPLCGDVIEVFLKLDADGKVADVAWEGSGCAVSQASMSALSEKLVGKSKVELDAMGVQDIERSLETSINPARLKCATLGLVAVQKALRQEKP